jgi:hypothetical protein
LNDDWMLSASVIIQEFDLGQDFPGLHCLLNFAYQISRGMAPAMPWWWRGGGFIRLSKL